jgi:hypothetical protein
MNFALRPELSEPADHPRTVRPSQRRAGRPATMRPGWSRVPRASCGSHVSGEWARP